MDFAESVQASSFDCWIALALIVVDMVLFKAADKAIIMIKNMPEMLADRRIEKRSKNFIVLSVAQIIENDRGRF